MPSTTPMPAVAPLLSRDEPDDDDASAGFDVEVLSACALVDSEELAVGLERSEVAEIVAETVVETSRVVEIVFEDKDEDEDVLLVLEAAVVESTTVIQSDQPNTPSAP